MKTRFLGFSLLAMVASGAALAACSSMGDSYGSADEAGDSAGSGWNTGTGSTGPTGSTGTGFGTGGGGAGENPSAPSPIPPPPDAGPSECASLDSSKPLVLFVSADDSNSMASPVVARELLEKGQAPWSIRTYEFLNYYRIDYPAAPSGALSLIPEGAPGAEPGTLDLQIGVRSFDPVGPRRPITLTLVLDASGSMDGEPIAREKAAVEALAASLAKDDIVNAVTWDTQNAVVLDGHVVSGPNDPVLLQLADALQAGGGTDLHGGLVAGYDLAKKHYGKQRLNRVVLISDGGANVGITDEDLIALHSEDADQEGIYMVGIGAGPAQTYNDMLMDVVTDKGRGAYVYLDHPDEAQRLLSDRFDEVMEVAARGVQIELTLPWYFQMQKFYGEEYSTDVTEIEPQHLAPGDAMVLNQVLKACDESVMVGSDQVQIKATWRTPITYVAQEAIVTTSVDSLMKGRTKGYLAKGKAIVAYAEALKAGTNEALHQAHGIVVEANADATDPELNEIAALIQLHPNF